MLTGSAFSLCSNPGSAPCNSTHCQFLILVRVVRQINWETNLRKWRCLPVQLRSYPVSEVLIPMFIFALHVCKCDNSLQLVTPEQPVGVHFRGELKAFQHTDDAISNHCVDYADAKRIFRQTECRYGPHRVSIRSLTVLQHTRVVKCNTGNGSCRV